MKFESKFALRDRVLIDGDDSLRGTVTGFRFHDVCGALIEVAWVHNGDHRTAWVEEWRVSLGAQND